jgi:hypothetical protein
MTTRTIAVGVVALILAACGGSDDEVGTTSGATQQQYASLLGGNEGAWREIVANLHHTCADPSAADKCAAAYLTASQQAAKLRSALSSAGDGTEPEIATLIAETEAAAAEYSAAFEAWEATGCVNPIDSNCGAEEAGAMFAALGEVTRQLDAWEPYTG